MTARDAVVVALACCTSLAYACGESLSSPRIVDNAHYVVAFATTPNPIPFAEHFVVDFEVCPRAARAYDSVRIDAAMPEHRHGMNYRPVIDRRGGNVYRAEGLLFHMRGRWEIAFDVVTGSDVERVAASVVLE